MRPLSRRRAPQLGGLGVPGIVIGGIGRAWAGTTRYTPIPGEPLDAGSAEQSGDGPPWEDAPRQRLAEMLIFTERRWQWACRTRNEELSIILLDDEPADSRRCVLVRFRRRKPEPPSPSRDHESTIGSGNISRSHRSSSPGRVRNPDSRNSKSGDNSLQHQHQHPDQHYLPRGRRPHHP
jgi:hypothetical protein